MSQNETPVARWTTTGKIFDRYVNNNPVPNEVGIQQTSDLIKIPENARSVNMGNDNGEAYGIPIDAKLAIALIAGFQHDIDMTNKIFSVLLSPANLQPLKVGDNSEEEIKILFHSILEILNRSAAITIDKNIILKTLSQPKCEGIRFYMCKKMVPDDATQAQRGEGTPYYSLVTVGVDAEGKDLHYDYHAKMVSKGSLKNSILSTESLTGEYASPPPPNSIYSKDKQEETFDKKYVLHHYAKDLA